MALEVGIVVDFLSGVDALSDGGDKRVWRTVCSRPALVAMLRTWIWMRALTIRRHLSSMLRRCFRGKRFLSAFYAEVGALISCSRQW